MAVDEKTKLKITLGSVIHNLPLYDDYGDFYNQNYLRINAFNKTLYAPLSPTFSNLAINAGVEKAGRKYYFLTRAYKNTEEFSSSSSFLSNTPNNNTLTERIVLTAECDIPEDGVYLLDFNVDIAFGVYQMTSSSYYLKGNFEVSLDKNNILMAGINSRDDGYHPIDLPSKYIKQGVTKGDYSEENLEPSLLTFYLGGLVMPLKAGKIRFNLLYTVNNKTYYNLGTLLKNFRVTATSTGFKNLQKITTNSSWTPPSNWDSKVKVLLYGAGGGGGGGATEIWYSGDHSNQRERKYVGGVGGEGELKEISLSVSPTSYDISVGVGGKGGFTDSYYDDLYEKDVYTPIPAKAGGSTSAFGVTALGGGGGTTAGRFRVPDDEGGSHRVWENGKDGKSYGKGSKGGKGKLGRGSGLKGEDGKVIILYNLKGEV